jgi:hypothetical protein
MALARNHHLGLVIRHCSNLLSVILLHYSPNTYGFI